MASRAMVGDLTPPRTASTCHARAREEVALECEGDGTAKRREQLDSTNAHVEMGLAIGKAGMGGTASVLC
mgnify:CR=1 FL=1